MKNLLIITQKVDESDDLLGFFVDWIREFSKNFGEVFVITLAKGSYELPPNVHVFSLGKEKGGSRISRIFGFYGLLFKTMPKVGGVFAHMSPVFAIASWPLAVIYRKRIVLWYLHRSVTVRLRVAEKLSYKIVTAAKASLRLESKKVVEVGHGINTKAFECERSWDLSSGPARILAVGRMSPIKDYETLLSAVSMVKDTTRIEVTIVGQPVMSNDFAYYERLKEMTRELNIQDGITFRGFVPYKDIPDYYKNSDFVVNLSPTGGLDKVVLEAMAAKAIVLVANQAFGPHLAGHQERLLFKFRDPRDLALKIERLAGSPREELEKISRELHHSVWNNHQLSSTINKISQLFT